MASNNISCNRLKEPSEESNKMFDSVAAVYDGGKDALIRDLKATTENDARNAFVGYYEESDHSSPNESDNLAADIKNMSIHREQQEKLNSRAITNTPISILVRKFYENDAILPYCEEIVEQMCTTFSDILDEYCDPKKHPDYAGKTRAEILHALNKKDPRFISDTMYTKEIDRAIETLKNVQNPSPEILGKIAALNSLRIPDVWEGAVQLMYRKLQDIERINMGEVNSKAFKKFLDSASAVDFQISNIEGYTRSMSAFNTRVTYTPSNKKHKEEVALSTIEEVLDTELIDLLQEGKLSFTRKSYVKNYTYESAVYAKNKDRLNELVEDRLDEMVRSAKDLAKETGYELDEEGYKQILDEKERKRLQKSLQKKGVAKVHEIVSDDEVITRLTSSASSMEVSNIVLSGNNASITLTVSFKHDGAGTEEDSSFSGRATLELTGKEAKTLIKKLHPELYTRSEQELSNSSLTEGDTEDTSSEDVKEHSEENEDAEMDTEEDEEEEKDELTSLEESSLERWMEASDTKTVREGISSHIRRLFMRTVSLNEKGILGKSRTFNFNNMYIQMSELRDETRASNSFEFFEAIRNRANKATEDGDTDINSFNYFCKCLIHQLQTDSFRTPSEKMGLITLMFENFDKAATSYTTVSTTQVDANTSLIVLQDSRNTKTILFNSYHEYILRNATSSKYSIFNAKGNISIQKTKALKEYLDNSSWNDSTPELKALIEDYRDLLIGGSRLKIKNDIDEKKKEMEAETDPVKKQKIQEEIIALNTEEENLVNSVNEASKIRAYEEHKKEVLLRIRDSLMLNRFISLESINELSKAENDKNYKKFIDEATEFISIFSNLDLDTVEYFSDNLNTKTRQEYYNLTLQFFGRLNSVVELRSPDSEIRTERNTHFGKSNYNGLSQHSMITKQLDTLSAILKNNDKKKMKQLLEDVFLNDEFIASKQIINADTGEFRYFIYNEWIRELYKWATDVQGEKTYFLMWLENGHSIRGLGFTEDYVPFNEFTAKENVIFNFMHFLSSYHDSGKQAMLIPAFILGDSGSVRYLPTTIFKSQSHIMRGYLRSLLAELKAFKCVTSINQWCANEGMVQLPYSTKDGKLDSFFFPILSEKLKGKSENEIEEIVSQIEKAIEDSERFLVSSSSDEESMFLNTEEARNARANLIAVFQEYICEDIEKQYTKFKNDLIEEGIIDPDSRNFALNYKDFPISGFYQNDFESKVTSESSDSNKIYEGFDHLDNIKPLSRAGKHADDWLFFAFLNFKFGEMQHIHLTCGTPSLYRDVEDMQKRWKSWFATGSHLDPMAVDPNIHITAEEATNMAKEELEKDWVRNPLYDLSEEGRKQPMYYKKVCPDYKQKVGYFQDIRECTTAETDSNGRLVDSAGNTLAISIEVENSSKAIKEASAKALEKAEELAVRTKLGQSLLDGGVSTHQYELFKPVEIGREVLPNGKVRITYNISTKGSSITDGQAYRTLDSYRQIQIMLGKWNLNPNNEEFYKIVQEIGRLEKEEGRHLFVDGKLTTDPELRALYEKAISLNCIPQPMKPLYAGYEEIKTKNGVSRVSVFHKYSERILIPELMPEGEDKMLGYAMQKMGWDMMASTECVKVGRFGQAPVLDFSSQEALNAALDGSAKSVNGEPKIYTHVLSYDGYKEQSNIPYKMNHETIVGTQSRKINSYTNLGNEDESFECPILNKGEGDVKGLNDAGEGDTTDTVTLIVNEGEKLHIHRDSNGRFSGKDLMKLINCLLSGNWISSYRSARSSYTSRNKLRRMLEKSAVRDSKMSDNDLQSYDDTIRHLPFGDVRDFRIPLSEGLAHGDIIAHLLSFFKKQVIKQWTSGGSAVQISPLGSNLKMKITDDGNIEYTQAAQTFDYSYIDENGNEVKLNYLDYVDPVTGRLLKPDGTVCGEELDDELESKLHKEFPGILDSLAVRIPTEKLYSTIHVRSVKFYPPCMGGIMAVSSAYTTIAGFDFDIDKLYIKRFSFVKHAKHKDLTDDIKGEIWDRIYDEGKDQDGIPYKTKLNNAKRKAIQDVRDNPNLSQEEKDKQIAILLDVNKTHLNKFWSEAGIKDNKGKIFLGMMRKLGYGLTKEERRYIEKYGEWEGYHNGNRPVFSLDPVIKDNILLSIMLSRLHEKSTFKERYTPGNFCYIEQATPAMKRLTDGIFEEDGKVITDYKDFISRPYKPENPDPSNPSTIFHYQVNNNIYDREIAITAVQNIKQVLLAMCHKCRIGDNNRDSDVDPLLFGTMIDKKNDPQYEGIGVDYLLSRITHGLEDGNDAGLNLSQMLDAAVDAIKQATLEYFGVTPETSTYVTTLLALGAKWEDIGMLFNQPVIKEAMRLHNNDPKYKSSFERALEAAFNSMVPGSANASEARKSLKSYPANKGFELSTQVMYNSILKYAGYNSDGTKSSDGPRGYRAHKSYAETVNDEGFLNTQAQVVYLMQRVMTQSSALNEITKALRPDNANAYGIKISSLEDLIRSCEMLNDKLNARKLYYELGISPEGEQSVFPIEFELEKGETGVAFDIVNDNLFGDGGKLNMDTIDKIIGSPICIAYTLISITQDFLKCITPQFSQLAEPFKVFKKDLHEMTKSRVASPLVTAAADEDLVSMLVIRIANNSYLREQLHLDSMFDPNFVHTVFTQKGKGIIEEETVTSRELALVHLPYLLKNLSEEEKNQYAILSAIRVHTGKNGRPYLSFANMGRLKGDDKAIIGRSWAALVNPSNPNKYLQQIGRLLFFHCLYTKGMGSYSRNNANAWMDVIIKEAIPGYLDATALTKYLRVVDDKIVCPVSEDFDPSNPSTYEEVANLNEMLKVFLLNNVFGNNTWWQLCADLTSDSKEIYKNMIRGSESEEAKAIGMEYQPDMLLVRRDEEGNILPPERRTIVVKVPLKGKDKMKIDSKSIEVEDELGNKKVHRSVKVPPIIKLEARENWNTGGVQEKRDRYFVLKDLSNGNWVDERDFSGLKSSDKDCVYVEYELIAEESDEFIKDMSILNDDSPRLQGSSKLEGDLVSLADRNIMLDNLTDVQRAQLDILTEIFFGSKSSQSNTKPKALIVFDLETNGLLDGAGNVENDPARRIQIAEFSAESVIKTYDEAGNGKTQDISDNDIHDGKLKGYMPTMDMLLDMYSPNGTREMPPRELRKGVANPLYDVYKDAMEHKNGDTFDSRILLQNVLSPMVKMIEDGYDLYLGSFNGNAFDIPALARCFEYAIEEAKKRLDPNIDKYEKAFSEFCNYFNISSEQFEVGGQTRTRYIMKEDTHSIDALTIVRNMFPGKFYRTGNESNSRSHTLRDTVAALGILGSNTHLGKDDTKATRRLLQYIASYNRGGFFIAEDSVEYDTTKAILNEIRKLQASEGSNNAEGITSYLIAELTKDDDTEWNWREQVNKNLESSIESLVGPGTANEEYKKLLSWFIQSWFSTGRSATEYLKGKGLITVSRDKESTVRGAQKLNVNKEAIMELLRQMKEEAENTNLCQLH